jgi:hypothetical protein
MKVSGFFPLAASLAAAFVVSASAKDSTAPTNLVVITIDTLRSRSVWVLRLQADPNPRH